MRLSKPAAQAKREKNLKQIEKLKKENQELENLIQEWDDEENLKICKRLKIKPYQLLKLKGMSEKEIDAFFSKVEKGSSEGGIM